jgi:hypothetical protein
MKNPRVQLSIGLAVLLATVLAPTAYAASTTDRASAVARLESRAADLSRQMIMPPKRGRLFHARMRADVRAIETEVARLRAGGAVDQATLAALTGRAPSVDRDDPTALAKRADARREAMERRLTVGPKMGTLRRQAIREDVSRLDAVIAALESGREVDDAALGELLGVLIADASRSPAERLRDSEVQLATTKRRLLVGPKMGSLQRAQLRDQIEALDAMIDQLERQTR